MNVANNYYFAGIQLQTDRIPLRFLVQQLHDGFQIVVTGIVIP